MKSTVMKKVLSVAMALTLTCGLAACGSGSSEKAKDEKKEEKIDWTNAWGGKYPILIKYQSEVNIPYFARGLETMLKELGQEYQYNELDTFLVLKDILYNVWKNKKKN